MTATRPVSADEREAIATEIRTIVANKLLGREPEPSATDAPYVSVLMAGAMADALATVIHESISTARHAGHTWSQIGTALGVSRQAAQQRFGIADDRIISARPGEMWRDNIDLTSDDDALLHPVDVYNEIAVLNYLGKLGWHSVGFGIGHHRVRRTDEQWEHDRIVFPSRVPGTNERLMDEGWQLIGTFFPWDYVKRPLGKPAYPPPPEPVWDR